MIDGLESELKRLGSEVDLDISYMDTKRFSDAAHYENLYALYKNKSRHRQYDLIITTDNNAFLFVLSYGSELYPNVPVVFCGVDSYHGSMFDRRPWPFPLDSVLAKHDEVTGVFEELDYASAIDVALRLHPRAKQVILVNDGINQTVYWPVISEEDIAPLVEKFAGRVRFSSFMLTKDNQDELLRKIKGREKESVLLLTGNFLDPYGRVIFEEVGLTDFWQRCQVPVYTTSEELVSHGFAVGGYINSSYLQGKLAADMAIRILNGENPGNIPIVRKGPATYMFNYSQLRRFGISSSELPSNSIIVGQPKSFYYRYKGLFWLVTGIILCLAGMVVILSVNIVRRKRAEGKLWTKNIAIESSINAIAFADMQGNIAYVNNSFLKLWGYSSTNEVLGKPTVGFWLDKDKAGDILEKVREGEGCVGELTAKKEDGSTFDVQLSANLVRDEMGEPIYLMASFVDVSERKLAQEALKESEERFRNLMEYIPGVSIQGYDSTGTVFYWNKASEKVYGYTAEEAIGRNLADLIIPSELRPLFEKGLELSKSIKSSGEFMPPGELMLLHKKGHLVPVYSIHTAVNIQGKKPLLFCIDVDLSERKRVEEKLRESQYRQRAILDSIPDTAWLKDKQGRYIAVNEPLANLCGAKPEDLVGKTDWDIWPHDLAEKYVADDREVMASGKRKLIEEQREDKNGKRSWVETVKTPIYNDSGEVIGASGIARDVTERKLSEESLQKVRDELEDRVQQRTSELARANRELRNEIKERKRIELKLLDSQKKLRLLASELSLAEERLRRRIATDVHDHVGQNLAISKIKLDSLAESVGSSELAESLKEVGELIAQTIQSTRSLTFELSPPVLYELGFEAAVEWLVRQTKEKYGIEASFESDGATKVLDNNVRVLLFQAVRELLVNVAKHSKARNVKVSSRSIGDEIEVTVTDNGVGFDMRRLDSRDYSAGGFGLFSIRERLDYIGGRIGIESRLGQGTWVTLVAPTNHADEQSQEKCQ